MAISKNDQTQSEKFVEAARKLSTDESEAAFDRVLRKVASAPPSPAPRPRRGQGKRPKKSK